MFSETPQTLLAITVGAFVLGWVVARIGSRLAARAGTRRRDPRDDRIRSLEADLRVAHASIEKLKAQLESRDKELADARKQGGDGESAIRKLDETIARLREDLRSSVKKTHELRAELTERAAENVRSEVKLREVETELSVVQASTDLLATGMLDYGTPDDDEDERPSRKAGA